MTSMLRLAGWLVVLAWAIAPVRTAEAQSGAASDRPAVDFSRQIQPILAKRCFPCHGPDKAEAGLRLNGREAALAGLDSGEHAIVPSKPDQSELLRRVTSDDESTRMPPEGKPLSAAEIQRLRQWIADGAPFEQHWAFQPPVRQDPPAVKNAAWVSNPVDAFILAKLEQNGLAPAPPADKVALLRRLYYDLTGLPPTPEEVDAFVADRSSNAYETIVDRLLASPRYGERWARHWLDVVRFAETNSFERDGVKANAWRYRDYVIRSFNDDKPYGQFIREQLAGDELPEVTTDSIIATGYYRLGLWDDEPADPLQARYDELDDIVATTSQVFLGLTVNCARCHDHKIDPIPQADYYRLLAFFHDIQSYGVRSDQRSFNQTEISSPEIAAAHQKLDAQKRQVESQLTGIEQRGIEQMSAEDQRNSEGRGRAALLKEKLQDYLNDADWRRYGQLQAEMARLNATKLPPRESALSLARCLVKPPPTHILMRGNAHVAGDEVQPGFPAIFAQSDPVIPAPSPEAKSSGRRSVLANWIASPGNMLTARVMANRVWQHHFGRGIVRSTNNFGYLGDPPTHPELLDWLAQAFVDGGWRFKPLHKLIVMSSTYRMSSQANAAALAKDPVNNLFWRFDMRRLEAEEIRDAIHAVTGELNLAMYGPGIYPAISAEVLAGQSRPGEGWGKSSREEQARRSIYIHVKRSLVTPLLADFDFPDTDSSCAARFTTTQPAQALGMLNGDFLNRRAAALAERLRREAGDDVEAQIKRALRLTLCRQPDERHVERGLALIDSLVKNHGIRRDKALDYYCLMVLNLNEFVYLD
jgi:mono/diheme cytochrome c family protein